MEVEVVEAGTKHEFEYRINAKIKDIEDHQCHIINISTSHTGLAHTAHSMTMSISSSLHYMAVIMYESNSIRR